jgi:hypothetical protein
MTQVWANWHTIYEARLQSSAVRSLIRTKAMLLRGKVVEDAELPGSLA